ncbi:PQ-loop-domain-containing protein [Periconia macrospinosa]|uniref:PQ-loop-domain-containing protein n=1 Tax=Periconia macrospinosa TaxID=97972 RepID=A0A2V1E474_9PLEO|nr:PQ-loop-domain-containing protein [Periconia macrospinosa]
MTRPQDSIPPAANVLGTIGTVCWCVQVLPQIWHNWRRKTTDGLPGVMLMLWAGCAVPFGVYAIVQNFNIALQLQPQCFGGLTLITWGQTLYYHNKWRAWTATFATVGMAMLFAGTEALLIFTLRKPYYKGIEWPMMMMAIIASVMQCVGLLLPFWELAKRNGRVIGINFGFLTIDYAGAFFSLMALVAQHTFDVLGSTMYIVCMTLETGIFLSHAIWLWRVRHVRREAKKAGQTYDEFVAKHPSMRHDRSSSPSDPSAQDVEAGHHQTTKSTETLVQDNKPEKDVKKPEKAMIRGQEDVEKKDDDTVATTFGEHREKISTGDDYTG